MTDPLLDAFVSTLRALRADPVHRTYLSGPMTGLPDLNFPAFNAYAARLRADGQAVVNPVELNPDPDAAWADCMRVDIAVLCACDSISMIPGWEQSRGANLERYNAQRLGLPVVYLPAGVVC